MRTRQLVLLLSALFAFKATPIATLQNTDMVHIAVEKLKSGPFWFELNTIHLPYVPLAYQATGTTTKLSADGSVKGSGSGTYEFTPVAGYFTIAKILARNDRLIDPREKAEFDSKGEKRWEEFRKQSDKDKETAKLRAEKERVERNMFWDEFLRAYQFELAGRKAVGNRATTQFAFVPLSSYKPGKIQDAKYLPKLKGQIWIDDLDGEVARLEFEFTEDVKGFVGLGSVYKGSQYSMDLAKQIHGLWLPTRAETYLAQRMLLSKNRQTYVVEFRNYRKFGTDVQIRTLK